jgi:general secretion pathway protein G
MSGDTRRRSRRGWRGAFTLIEVMIVIAIVLALTGLIGYAVLGRRDEAKRDLAKIDLNTIKSSLKFFRNDFDRYPTDDEGLKVLWDKSALSADADQAKWHAYLEEPMPADRWGTPWVYKAAGEHGDGTMFDLSSNGPDKQPGTDDDITSWGTGAAGASGASGTNEEAPPPAPARPASPASGG